jgi:hypothetical protein
MPQKTDDVKERLKDIKSTSVPPFLYSPPSESFNSRKLGFRNAGLSETCRIRGIKREPGLLLDLDPLFIPTGRRSLRAKPRTLQAKASGAPVGSPGSFSVAQASETVSSKLVALAFNGCCGL